MLRLFASGDVYNCEQSSGLICSKEIENIINSCDYAVCNFEAPIHVNVPKEPKMGPSLSQYRGTVRGLKKHGYNLLLLANNHMLDYGLEGLSETINEIKNNKLEFIGAGLEFNDAYLPLIKEVNGTTVGLFNACEAQFGVYNYDRNQGEPGYAWINHYKVDKIVSDLKKQCDFVVIFVHAGLENYNIPQKEWRMRYRQLCNSGADVVIGSHPHVPQGYEHYDDSIIFYSLGNFYFDSAKYKDKKDSSYSIILNLEKDKKVSFDLIYHHKENGAVKLSNEENKISILGLNELLREGYDSTHLQMSLRTYDTIRRNLLYSLMPFPYDGSVKGSLYRIYMRVFLRKPKIDKNLLQLHYLRNESYYYATLSALEHITNEKGGKHERFYLFQ